MVPKLGDFGQKGVKKWVKKWSKSGQKGVKNHDFGVIFGPSHVPLYMVFIVFFLDVLKVGRLLGSLDFQDLTVLSFLGPPFWGCPKKPTRNGYHIPTISRLSFVIYCIFHEP